MLLLSIHPKFVDQIISGEKRVELRRRRPRVDGGESLIYATAPRMELIARFRIDGILHGRIELLWQAVRDVAGVSRQEFDAYYRGLTEGTAIRIADVKVFARPIPLHELRAGWQGFHPPQSFRYVDRSAIDVLGLGPLSSRVA